MSKQSKSKNKNKAGSKLSDTFKFAAVTSAGAILGIIPQLLIGSIILLIGIYLVTKQKKPNTDKNGKKQYHREFEFYLGIGLILIGSVISLNLFFGLEFITELFDSY